MNLPDWATHVAVDANGEVWAFSCEPVWSEHNETWNVDEMERSSGRETMEHLKFVPPSVARLLCIEIPRVPVEDAGNGP